jgi:hypothetical protein
VPAAAIGPLLEALSDEGSFEEDVGDYYGGAYYESRFVSDAAERALGGAEIEAIGAALEGLIVRGSVRARRHAARLLGRRVESRGLLLDAAEDADGGVREAALEALVALRPRTSPLDDAGLIECLLDHVWDSDDFAARTAVDGLEKVGAFHPRFPSRVERRLGAWSERLRGGADAQRICACRVLGKLTESRPGAELLADLLIREESSTVLRYAAESLALSAVRLERPRREALLAALHEWRMSYARPPLMAVLARQRIEGLSGQVLRYALDGEPEVIASAPLFEEVRAAARAALRSCGEGARGCLPAIAERLRGGSPGVAVDLLGSLPAVADEGVVLLAEHLDRARGEEALEKCLEALERLGERSVAAFPKVVAHIEPGRGWRIATAATRAVAAMGAVAEGACPAIERVLRGGGSQILMLYAVVRMGRFARPLFPLLRELAEMAESPEARRLARKILDAG